MIENIEPVIPQYSWMAWYLRSLGIRYVLLLAFVAVVSLLLIWRVTDRERASRLNSNRLTALLSLVVPLPAIVGLISVFDGMMAGLSSFGCNGPYMAEIADAWSTALVALQVGIWLTIAGMLLAIWRLSICALGNDTPTVTREESPRKALGRLLSKESDRPFSL